MENYKLVEPNESYINQIASYRQEFMNDGSSLEGCGSLVKIDNPIEWIQESYELKNSSTVPANWVVSDQYLYVRSSDNRIVAMAQIRHCFNDFIEKYAGHIGYSVRPSERKKGIAKQLLHDCLPLCRQLGLNQILLCCVETNEGSRRTILSNGGRYESSVVFPYTQEVLERYWISL